MSYSPTTSAGIKITTDFGIDTNYGTALTNETIEVEASNYKNAVYQTTAVSTGDTQRGTITNNAIYKMLNVALPSELTGTYTAADGVTYQYKITATNGTSSLSERNIIYTTTWGVGNYNNTWGTTTTLKLTTSNYNTSNITTTYRTTQETATKNYLDTLISTVNTPAAITKTFSTTSGKTVYVRTTATGSNSSVSATSCAIKYTTVYGLDTNYGYTYSSNVTFNVTASNYTSWASQYASAVATEQEKVKNTDIYKMLNLALPSTLSGTYTPSSTGVSFGYTVSAKNGTSSATERNIIYTTTWSLQNYGAVYAEYTLNLTTSNYSTANITSSTATTQLDNLKAYLDTVVPPYTIPTPTQIVEYTASSTGLKWYIKVRCIPATGESIIQTEARTCNIYLSHGTDSTTQDCGPINVICGSVSIDTSNYKSFATNLSDKITEVLNTYKADLENLVSKDYTISTGIRTLTTASGSSIYYNNNGEVATGSLVRYTSSSTKAWTNSYSGFNITSTLKYGLSNSTSALVYTYIDSTFAVTKNNYKTISSEIQTHTDTVMKAQNFYKVMNVSVPSGKTGSHTTNGKTYYYQIAFTQGSVDTFSDTFNYTVKWGTSSGSYTNLAASSCLVVTRDTYSTLSTTASSTVTAEETALKTYLNNLPGVTSTTINVVTDYGISTSYGTALTSGSVIVDTSNYKDAAYQTTVVSTGDIQRGTITNTNVYKMLNIDLPSNHSDTYTATNGKTYSFTTTYSQGTTDLTQNNIICTTKYTRQDNTVKTYNSTTRKFTTSNCSAASNNLASNMSTQEQNLKDYLDTLLVMPTKYSNTYTKGGCKYYFEIYYTIPDEESHDVTATAKVDLLTLKSSTVTCTNMSDFNTKKTSMQSTKISEMENAVSDSPLNSSTTVQGMTITTSYTKNAITSSSVDGNIYGSVSVEESVVYGPINFGKLTTFTNYKFVYTTIVNDINAKVSEITDILNNSLPVNGSYTYQSTDNFGCDISYTYTRNILLYSLSISIDGVIIHDESQYLNINEAFKIESRMKYLLAKYESMIKNVTPVDIEQTYNGITIARKFSKNPSSNKVTCELYVDGVKRYTYTGTFDLSKSILKEDLQSLGEGDYDQYLSNAKSLNISVSTTTTITSNGKNYNVYILPEKVGSKIRVYRVIGNMKTNYIDVDINYLNASTTKTAIQTAANRLILNLNTAIDFYRPPSEAALVELLKVITA